MIAGDFGASKTVSSEVDFWDSRFRGRILEVRGGDRAQSTVLIKWKGKVREGTISARDGTRACLKLLQAEFTGG